MNPRGLMFCTTLLVLGSALLASQAARQRRLARLPGGREGPPRAQAQPGARDGNPAHPPGTSSGLDTSVTSRSIPP